MGCNRGPAVESNRAAVESAENKAAEQRKRSDEAAELERRAANLDSQWTEMQTKRARTATAGLREEVQEDVKNAQAAVADLKTTTEENWWERHERARTVRK
jgi:type VI protein secretion system component VasF